jgi:hypothetical protein
MSKIDSNPRNETVTELKGRKPLVGLFTVAWTGRGIFRKSGSMPTKRSLSRGVRCAAP